MLLLSFVFLAQLLDMENSRPGGGGVGSTASPGADGRPSSAGEKHRNQ